MPSLHVRDADLAYDIRGDEGPLVVQLHGLTSSRARDALLGLDLARAVRHARVLRYDARAHGESGGEPISADYRWARLAEDLLALLDHVAPGEPVHGVGPSMGTGTLLHAAVREPGRFASLTLVTPSTAWRSRAAQAATYQSRAELVERLGMGAFIHNASTAPVPPGLDHLPIMRPTVPEALLPAVLRGAAASDFPPQKRVAAISVPTLVLAWTGDPGHPVSTAEALGRLIPGSRVAVARQPPEVLHWPGLFAEQVRPPQPA